MISTVVAMVIYMRTVLDTTSLVFIKPHRIVKTGCYCYCKVERNWEGIM